MDTQSAIHLGRQVLVLVVLITTPIVGVGLVVGVVVALLQAVTSLQDQTLSIVPKVLMTVGALFLMLPWILTKVTDFSRMVLSNLSELGASP